MLWESNAIVRYLSRTYGAGRLWPGRSAPAADADRWMDWQATTLTPAMGDAFMQLVRTPAEQRDAAAGRGVDREDRAAHGDPRRAPRRRARTSPATTLTMGDIPVACAAHRWLGLPCERTPRPHVERWVAGLRARPAFGEVLTLPIT